jgi:hypothetical protein
MFNPRYTIEALSDSIYNIRTAIVNGIVIARCLVSLCDIIDNQRAKINSLEERLEKVERNNV